MREMGLGEDEIAALLEEEPDDEVFDVSPDNWPAVQLYLSCYGQFVFSATGQVLGFDFGKVDVDIRRSGLEVTEDTWQRFKTLQHHTVQHLRQRQQQQHHE
jgi:hypothetical protein